MLLNTFTYATIDLCITTPCLCQHTLRLVHQEWESKHKEKSKLIGQKTNVSQQKIFWDHIALSYKTRHISEAHCLMQIFKIFAHHCKGYHHWAFEKNTLLELASDVSNFVAVTFIDFFSLLRWILYENIGSMYQNFWKILSRITGEWMILW